MKHKYNCGQVVKIYQNPACVSGGVGKILERDANEKSYMIGDDFDSAIWVAEEHLEALEFKQKKPKVSFLDGLILGLPIGSVITILILSYAQ